MCQQIAVELVKALAFFVEVQHPFELKPPLLVIVFLEVKQHQLEPRQVLLGVFNFILHILIKVRQIGHLPQERSLQLKELYQHSGFDSKW
jgi:hypothetical protein